MTKTKAFFKNFKYELISLFVNLVITLISFLITTPNLTFLLLILVFFMSTLTFIYIKTKESNFYFYSFDNYGQDRDWVGRGTFKFLQNELCYEITNAGSGYILPKTSTWDDYKFQFDFKIIKSSIGIIVRADNLSNYVMYQFFADKYKSHFRINGQWIVFEEIKLDQKIEIEQWNNALVNCDKRNITITISNTNRIIFVKHLNIPDSIVVVHKQLNNDNKETNKEINFRQDIDFDFGSVGFRNHGNEKAFIRNVLIEKI